MKVQHHVNKFEAGFWPKCREVSIVDGRVRARLSLDRSYSLVQAYQSDPHVQLISCATDNEILQFVRKWGPLCPSIEELERGICSATLSSYWVFQRWLKGIVNLLTSFKNSAEERQALQKFIDAESDEWRESSIASPDSEPFSISALRIQFRIKGAISAWLDHAHLAIVRSAIQLVIEAMPFGGEPHLVCVRRSSKAAFDAGWTLNSLREALQWMVWYDEFVQHPLVCCHACRKIFRPETAHQRKYCSYECAHRIAARHWQRKQRKSGRN